MSRPRTLWRAVKIAALVEAGAICFAYAVLHAMAGAVR